MDSPPPLYHPLDTDKAQIRLLTIKPGQMGDPIRTLFTIVSLDGNPQYEAISYVWGDSKDRCLVELMGNTKSITNSLHGALSKFRNSDTARVVWADALCINQDDLKEKGSQVGLMARIYRQCEVCQVWLGDVPRLPIYSGWIHDQRVIPGSIHRRIRSQFTEEHVAAMIPVTDWDPEEDETVADLEAAVAVMHVLATSTDARTWPSFRLITKADGQKEFGLCPRWMRGGRTFAMILNQSWWTRVWTFQEAALAPRANLNFAAHDFDLKMVLSAALCYRECRLGQAFESIISGEIIDPGCKLLKQIDELGLVWLDQILAAGPDRFTGNDVIIHKFLASTRKASNPLDLVFGFLGVLPSLIEGGTVVDYEMSPGRCFAQATRQGIRLTESITHLNYLSRTPERDPLYNQSPLPSWAIDYLDTSSFDRKLMTDLYEACGSGWASSYWQGSVPHDDDELPVYIGILDCIDKVSSLQAIGIDQFTDLGQKILQGCRYWQDMLAILYEADRAKFWRTVCTDIDVFDPFAEPQTLPTLHTHRLQAGDIHELETLFADLEMSKPPRFTCSLTGDTRLKTQTTI